MRRKQASQHLEHKEHVMLENAFYQVSLVELRWLWISPS
jgi:hypothetical protein